MWCRCHWVSESISRTLGWVNPSSCIKPCEWLSSHSCNYVSSIGCCQYGTCTHQFHSCLQFLSHTDAAAAVETHYCPGVVKYRYRYQYQYHTVTGLAACRSVRRVCISLSFGHNWALLCTAVCSTHNVTVALLAVCYCLTATFKQQTSCIRTNVAWKYTICLLKSEFRHEIFPALYDYLWAL